MGTRNKYLLEPESRILRQFLTAIDFERRIETTANLKMEGRKIELRTNNKNESYYAWGQ